MDFRQLGNTYRTSDVHTDPLSVGWSPRWYRIPLLRAAIGRSAGCRTGFSPWRSDNKGRLLLMRAYHLITRYSTGGIIAYCAWNTDPPCPSRSSFHGHNVPCHPWWFCVPAPFRSSCNARRSFSVRALRRRLGCKPRNGLWGEKQSHRMEIGSKELVMSKIPSTVSLWGS